MLGGVAAVVVVLGALLGYVLLTRDDGATSTVAGVAVGECFSGTPNEVVKVGCTQPHRFEMVAIAPAPDPAAPFPGAEKALEDGAGACVTALADYYGASADQAVADGLELSPIAPTEAQWNAGETDTFCLARRADGSDLDASIKGRGAAG